jgi:hypothetical protein
VRLKQPLAFEPENHYRKNGELDIARLHAGLATLGPDYLAVLCRTCNGSGQKPSHTFDRRCYCNGWGITYPSGRTVTSSVFNQVWEMGEPVLLLFTKEHLQKIKEKENSVW